MSNDKKVDVTITVDNHKHEGQPVEKGATVTTDEATGRWLVDNKLGVYAGGAVAATKKDAK